MKKTRAKTKRPVAEPLKCCADGCTDLAAVKVSGQAVCGGHLDWAMSTIGFANITPIKGASDAQAVMGRLMNFLR